MLYNIIINLKKEMEKEKMKEIVTLALTEGCHELPPVDGFIFPKEADPTNLGGVNDTVSKKLQSFVGIKKSSRMGLNQSSWEDVECFEGEKILHLYVTGLTVLTASVISYCALNGISLTLFHYDRETKDYYPQRLFGGNGNY